MNEEYKTYEELKEELGDKFEEYMYKSNVELLEQLNQKNEIIEKAIEYIKCNAVYDIEYDTNFADNLDQDECNELLEILNKYKGDNNE